MVVVKQADNCLLSRHLHKHEVREVHEHVDVEEGEDQEEENQDSHLLWSCGHLLPVLGMIVTSSCPRSMCVLVNSIWNTLRRWQMSWAAAQ
jgi:hypothetical protein